MAEIASTSKPKRHVSEILKSIKERLTCSICLRIYEQPITLSCGHSFCKVCIQEWMTSSRCREPLCPNCKTPIATNISDEHPVNIDLQNLCEAYKDHCKTSFSCTNCNSERQSASWCSRCEMALCSSCINEVCEESDEGTQEQHIPKAGGFYLANENEGQMCPIHPEEEAKFVCMLCLQILCGVCGTVDGRHTRQGHPVVTRSDAVAKLKSRFRDISERIVSLHEEMGDTLEWLNSLKENQLSRNNVLVERASEIKNIFCCMVDTYVKETQATFENCDNLGAKLSKLSFLVANLEILRKSNDERPAIKTENFAEQIKMYTKFEKLLSNISDIHIHFEKELNTLTLSTIEQQVYSIQELKSMIVDYLGTVAKESLSLSNQENTDRVHRLYLCHKKTGDNCVLKDLFHGDLKILKPTVYDLGDEYHNLSSHRIGHCGELVLAVDASKNQIVLINLNTRIISVLRENLPPCTPHSIGVSSEGDKVLVAISAGTDTYSGSIFVYVANLSELKMGQSPKLSFIQEIPDVDPAELSFGPDQLLAYIDHKFSGVVFKSFITECSYMPFKWRFQLPKIIHFCANTGKVAAVYQEKTLISFQAGIHHTFTNYDTSQCGSITGVTTDKTGSIWASDGNRNQVVHFSHDGKLLHILYAEAEWFVNPHSISIHNDELIVMIGFGDSSRLVKFSLN